MLGLGFVAYAIPGVAIPGSPSDGSDGPSGSDGGSAISNGLSFALVPTPVFLHQEAPSNYSFKEGGALIVASGDKFQVRTSFIGSPQTDFVTVLQTATQNMTLGTVTTGHDGGATFKGNVTLQPGRYDIGLLVFVSGQSASPVGVSLPRGIQVTLPGATGTSTSSSATNATESSTASSTSTTLPPSQAVGELGFTPITGPNASSAYPYGEGSGRYSVQGGSVFFSLEFNGQKPSTGYSLALSVNGTAPKTIGEYTTNEKGSGSVTANSSLGEGSFVLGLTVVDQSTFAVPTPVLSSVPSSFTVNSYGTVTTSTSTSTSEAAPPANGLSWNFKLVPAAAGNVPKGYRFATTGTAVVSLDPRDSSLDVMLGFQDANPSTTYDASLTLNGSSTDLGSMTTNRGGAAVLHASIQVSPGRYLMGVTVYDVSDVAAFDAGAPVLVLVSDPSTQLAVIASPIAEGSPSVSTTSSSESQATSSSSSTTTVTRAATTIDAGTQVQAQIQSAVGTLTIPATVQVTPLSSSTTVLDSRFSVSVGQQVDNGLAIAISGENVTGPRVLLVNMSKTSPLSLYPALNVTLDGSPVAEASSSVQVLNPVSGNPPLYVLVATSNSIQLLISIPHFSVHLIQVAGLVVHGVVNTLELDAPLLLGSILVITLAFVGSYATRRRFSLI